MKTLTGYCIRYGPFWIAWILRRHVEEPRLYYDNDKAMTMYGEIDIAYMTIGLTKRGTMRRLKNFVERRL